MQILFQLTTLPRQIHWENLPLVPLFSLCKKKGAKHGREHDAVKRFRRLPALGEFLCSLHPRSLFLETKERSKEFLRLFLRCPLPAPYT